MKDYYKLVNKTDRSKGGAVGDNPIVPRWVLNNVKPNLKILDFGAGKTARHAQTLRDYGFTDIDATDIGDNFVPGVHVLPKYQDYDVVYLSNVLNVQPTEQHVHEVLIKAHTLTKNGGRVVFNYPQSPRKSNMKLSSILDWMPSKFGEASIKSDKNVYIYYKQN